MKPSLGQLLDEQLPFIAAQWPPANAYQHEAPRPGDHAGSPLLAGSRGPLHYTQLLAAVHSEDRAPWLAEIRRAGAARAAAGTPVAALIAESLGCLNTVRR